MHRFRAGVLAGLHDPLHHQIALSGGRRADQYGFICHIHMQGVPVGFGIDRDGFNAHFAGGFDHAAGDFTTVGNQNFLEHVSLLPHSGMLPCLRHGFSSSLSRSIASERQIRLRVPCGMITSSMKPR